MWLLSAGYRLAAYASLASSNARTSGLSGSSICKRKTFIVAPSAFSSVCACSLFDGIDTLLLELLEVIVHFLEPLGGVTLPLRHLADDAKWMPRPI